MRAWLTAIMLLLLLATARAEGPPPFQNGDSVRDYQVVSVLEHPEFLRLELSGPAGTLTAEIIARRGPEGEFTSHDYQVQPGPGGSLPGEVAAALAMRLREWEAGGERPAVVQAFSHPLKAGRPETLRWMLVLWGLLALILPATLAGWWRLQPEDRRWMLAGGALALTLGGSWWTLPDAQTLPVEWITPLHEGFTSRSIPRLYGQDIHAGAGYLELIGLLPDKELPLRRIVRMNTGLALFNAGAVLAACGAVTGSWPVAVALTLAFLASKGYVWTALSEVPSQVLLLLTLLAALSWRTALIARERRHWSRWPAALALLLVTVWITLIREELFILAAVPCLSAIAGREAARRPLEALWRGWRWIAGVHPLIKLPIAFAISGPLVWVARYQLNTWSLPERSPILGAMPLNGTPVLWIPLLATEGSLTFALLAAAGAAVAFSTVETFLPGLALLVLLRVYLVGAVDLTTYHASVRYLAQIQGVVVLLAAAGARAISTELRRWLARYRPNGAWGRGHEAFLALLILVPLPAFAWTGALHLGWWGMGLVGIGLLGHRETRDVLNGSRKARALAAVGLAGWLLLPQPIFGLNEIRNGWAPFAGSFGWGDYALAGDGQLETRLLIRLLDEHPEAVFIAQRFNRKGEEPATSYVAWGAGLPSPESREHARELPLPEGRRLLWYTSIEQNMPGSPPLPERIAAIPALWECTWKDVPPFTHPVHGRLNPVVTVSIREVTEESVK